MTRRVPGLGGESRAEGPGGATGLRWPLAGRALSGASPMRIRICFFPKIREKSADTVRPMAGPGEGDEGTDAAGCGLEPAAAGGWGAAGAGGGAAAASARPGPPDVTRLRPRETPPAATGHAHRAPPTQGSVLGFVRASRACTYSTVLRFLLCTQPTQNGRWFESRRPV